MKHRKTLLLLILAALCLLFCACGEYGTDDVARTVKDNTLFSKAEINDAMDIVVQIYTHQIDGCTLTEIIYDEAYSIALLKDTETYEEKAMILTSVYSVEELASNGNLYPTKETNTHNWLAQYDGKQWHITVNDPAMYHPGYTPISSASDLNIPFVAPKNDLTQE